jgi:lysophospholipase L1-like esterase
MKIKDYLILGTASLLIGYVFASIEVSTVKNLDPDTLVAEVPIDTTIDVKGKVALFIGDSHTSNHSAGWQKQLCDSVGFKMKNESVGGKTTYWMINQALYTINDNIDYCFVYGGANDMYGIISPQAAIENIKGIARMCNGHNVKCIVLTGFDPVKCTATRNPNYAKKYAMFQRLLLTEDMDGAIIVDTRVVERTDCWDGLCHMSHSGHTKVAKKVIEDLKFKKVSK